MRLSSFLLRGKLAPGKIWTGKHRLAHKPGEDVVARFHKRLRLEEQNMFYLRHPYLTVEQATGYAKELGKREQWLAKVKENHVRPYRPHVTLEDRLSVLNAAHSWE